MTPITEIHLNFSFLSTCIVAEIPSYIKVCGRRNPQLDNCIRNSVEAMRAKLREGIPELKIPSIEPMYMDNVSLADLPNFKAFARDVRLHGLSNFIVDNLHSDLEKNQFEVELTFKEVTLKADYDVNAKILVPVAGTGPINIVATDVTAKVIMNFKVIDRKGKKFVFFPSMNTKLNIKDYTSQFTPQEGPDSTLSTAINAALENSRQEIIDSTTPNLERKISEDILQIANKICKFFTYDELFPDRE
ncbi:uncharacterized protein LOC127289083 [Leptopilina boulardi]|uniref:uncharacterized protein LOC127289083 n=1 Tax=Leptopilina boulardi TaxID=63433 RepID=UPI0021F67730|nr:uncharacterized protein LOC127289083 [Leptopilina boulardi]